MSKKKLGAGIRAEAARAIDNVVSGGRSLDVALVRAEEKVARADRPLLRALCYGSLRYYFRLRAHLKFLLNRPLKPQDSVIESLLLVGIFQLADTRVPDHAAVSSTVDAARLLGKPQHTKLVNAVLRNFVRTDIADMKPESSEDQLNHPSWLIRRLRQDWPDDWLQILEANDDRGPMWLRVNGKKAIMSKYFEQNSISGRLLAGVDHAIRLETPLPVYELPGFMEGRVSVQDAAAQIAAPWLVGDGGKFILDACAAPGGKTGHLLELMRPDGNLTAIDSDPLRLAKVKETVARLGGTATTIVADAITPKEWWNGQYFDRILLDVPCSASGVIRRHPDIKVLRRNEDISSLAATQLRMLTALWTTLQQGGRLLYVTCSVFSEENEDVVKTFLDSNEDATENGMLPNNNIRALMRRRSTGYQILPGTEDVDGFYYACLEKLRTEPNERNA